MQYADLQLMAKTPLFRNLTLEQIDYIADRNRGYTRSYKRGDILLVAGDPIETCGLLLKGKVKIMTESFQGNQSIIADIGPGEFYGEPFNWLSYPRVPITVQASVSTTVFFIDLRTFIRPTGGADPEIDQIVLRNIVTSFAEKIILFRNKVEVLSQRGLRGKILMTVRKFAEKQGTDTPVIPFSRKEFAEYLCVNRNSLARELKEMELAGEIEVLGNRIRFCHREELLL